MDISRPLAPAALHILLALGDGPSHGYGVLQAVRERAIPLGTGSLYRHLSKLMQAGLVAEVPASSPSDPRRGVSYRITPRGRRALGAERDRLAALLGSLDAARRKGSA